MRSWGVTVDDVPRTFGGKQRIATSDGDHWVQTRPHVFGLIPLSEDYETAEDISCNGRI
jgi:hypothetical protein